MFTAASMTYQRQRKREKEAARRALAKMEVNVLQKLKVEQIELLPKLSFALHTRAKSASQCLKVF